MSKPKGKFILLGAGLPRTGTLSLKTALEHLLGGPCYHMMPFVMKGGAYDADHWKDALVILNKSNERFFLLVSHLRLSQMSDDSVEG